MRETIQNYGYIDSLSSIELVAAPIYLMIILVISYIKQKQNIREKPYYKYYLIGIFLKIIGALGFCYVYIKVYKGGDTVNYFESANAFSNLLTENTRDFMSVFFSDASKENFNKFSSTTGYPWSYMYFEPKTLLVIKIATPIVLICFNSFLLSTIIFSYLSYLGIWKMYETFLQYYPKQNRQIFFSFIALPSVLFWGSGILKDTITLSATCWFIHFFHKLFIKKLFEPKIILGLIVSILPILFIKPYILISLMPGVVFWMFYNRISKINHKLLKTIVFPFILIFSFSAGFFILNLIGEFDMNNLIKDASIKQNDLKQSYYKGSSFDIGSYEPTLSGALGVSPKALFASLYRPSFFDARNAQMILSALENFILISLTLFVLLKNKIFGVFRILFNHPLILFCLSYSILLGTLIGLSTSNFGALIRFKIAFAPFFCSSLILLFLLTNERKLIRDISIK